MKALKKGFQEFIGGIIQDSTSNCHLGTRTKDAAELGYKQCKENLTILASNKATENFRVDFAMTEWNVKQS
ncbi:hypothetical protein TNIN_478601 [Trichonephila inaurata madagascariensis]|uniref:Uncharacterized protein n=1 Tax=Trichonephila inaurata madagascariensis TaxID=2747483 RepID=A0A8X6XQ98_9ARAC|nr:hypothetical protein TNIN_478601 [Trichonephila inaurata madagascariensis]